MTDKISISVTCCVAFLASALTAGAQQSATSNPAAAAAGMTTGLPGAVDAQDLEMQRVRAASNMARKDAQAAALMRSSDRALEDQVYNQAIQNQQSVRQAKARAAEVLRQQKAANAYNRVSLNQIQTWSDDGTVKVERGVPPAVLQQIAENDVAEAEAALEDAEAEKSGFRKALNAPGNVARGAGSVMKGALGAIPFVGGNDDEPSATEAPAGDPYASYDDERPGLLKRVGGIFKKDDPIEPALTHEAPATSTAAQLTRQMNNDNEKPGFFKNVASNIPFLGRDDDAAPAIEAPQPAPQPNAPVKIPSVSATGEGLAKLQRDPPQQGSPVNAPSGVFGPQQGGAPAVVEPPAPVEEKTGMFAKLRNKIGGDNGGGFGSNSRRPNDGSAVDASLFPNTGDIPPLPAGTPNRVQSGEMLTGGSGSANGLPTSEEEKKGLFAGITGGISNAINGNDSDATPTIEPRAPKPALEKSPMSTQHNGGNAIYVVNAGAKFFRFGDTQFSSDVNDLPGGTVVKKIKAGDEWSTIQLSNGAKGNIKNGDISPANASQVASASFGAGAASAFSTAGQ